MYVCNWIGMLLNTDTAPLSHPNIVNSTGVNKNEIDLRIIKSPDICFFPLHCTVYDSLRYNQGRRKVWTSGGRAHNFEKDLAIFCN